LIKGRGFGPFRKEATMPKTDETLTIIIDSMDGLHTKVDGMKDDMSDIKVKVAKLEVSTEAHEREHERYNSWKSMSWRQIGVVLGIVFGSTGIIFGIIRLMA
jgi:hypothetical protein